MDIVHCCAQQIVVAEIRPDDVSSYFLLLQENRQDAEHFACEQTDFPEEVKTVLYGIWYEHKLAGGLHITRYADCAEFGYWVGKEYRQKGLATNAARAVVEGLLRERRSVKARVRQDNPFGPISRRVLEKVGLRITGQDATHFFFAVEG